jgi:hypothetical protein
MLRDQKTLADLTLRIKPSVKNSSSGRRVAPLIARSSESTANGCPQR